MFGSYSSPLVSVPLADSALTLILGPAGTTKQEGGRFLGVIGYSPLESQVGAAHSNIPEMALLSWFKSLQQFIASPTGLAALLRVQLPFPGFQLGNQCRDAVECLLVRNPPGQVL